ncbi:unnamed protein product [Rangifer tarandus platyrhynchus]|uniref:Uncharacterized protein n=2 Tax=Rangifer tarandus platyrhynchus TaxID=3082113 RepID=A0ACB0EIG9_RANTA|nr:unnamed protein product [Rangifer tarandus platyrhynchus]CAI9699976.1 unnamed protein product [Rangifer tarandus platyrhynchus]
MLAPPPSRAPAPLRPAHVIDSCGPRRACAGRLGLFDCVIGTRRAPPAARLAAREKLRLGRELFWVPALGRDGPAPSVLLEASHCHA